MHYPITNSRVIGTHPDGTPQRTWTEGPRSFIEGYRYAKAASGISYGAIEVSEIGGSSMTERRITTGITGSLNPSHEWSAIEAGYDKGDPIGYGATEQEAIADLNDQLTEAAS